MFKKFKTMSKEKEINIEDGNVQETVQNENNEQITQNENTEENQNTDKKVTTIQTLLTRRQKRLIL